MKSNRYKKEISKISWGIFIGILISLPICLAITNLDFIGVVYWFPISMIILVIGSVRIEHYVKKSAQEDYNDMMAAIKSNKQ